MDTPSPEKTTKKSTEPRHYHYIDALRGWAFLAVVLTHCGEQVTALPPRIATFTAHGGSGVGLFFVISAFTLISSAYARSRKEQNPTRNFYLRRFFRIAPLFWLGVLFYPLLMGLEPNRWTPEGVGPIHFLTSLAFLHGLYPTTFNSVVPGSWSIAVEMMFYLCVPFLVKILNSGTRTLWAIFISLLFSLGIGVLSNYALSPYWQGKWSFAYDFYFNNWLVVQIPVFLVGFLLFFVIRKSQDLHLDDDVAEKRIHSLFLLCLSNFLLINAIFTPSTKLIPDTMRFAVAHFLLAWSLSLVPWRVLVNPVIRYLGTVSFSGYICHFAFVFFTLPWLLGDRITNLGPVVQLTIYFVLTVAATAIAATITYRFVELPGVALGRKLIQRLEARGQQS